MGKKIDFNKSSLLEFEARCLNKSKNFFVNHPEFSGYTFIYAESNDANECAMWTKLFSIERKQAELLLVAGAIKHRNFNKYAVVELKNHQNKDNKENVMMSAINFKNKINVLSTYELTLGINDEINTLALSNRTVDTKIEYPFFDFFDRVSHMHPEVLAQAHDVLSIDQFNFSQPQKNNPLI